MDIIANSNMELFDANGRLVLYLNPDLRVVVVTEWELTARQKTQAINAAVASGQDGLYVIEASKAGIYFLGSEEFIEAEYATRDALLERHAIEREAEWRSR